MYITCARQAPRRTLRLDLLCESGEFAMSYEGLDDAAATVNEGI
jgi:hypothetical protein